jgi:hypothetical protein
MKLAWKKIIPALVTALLVGAIMLSMVRPDRLVGALAAGLFLLLVWGTVELIYRRRTRER